MDKLLIKYSLTRQNSIDVGGNIFEVKERIVSNTNRLNNDIRIKAKPKYQCNIDENKFEFMRNNELLDSENMGYRIIGELLRKGHLTEIQYAIIPRPEIYLFFLTGVFLIILGIGDALFYSDIKSTLLIVGGVILWMFGKHYQNETNETAENEFNAFLQSTKYK